MVSTGRIKTYLQTHGVRVIFPLFRYYLGNIFIDIVLRFYNLKKVSCNYCDFVGNKFYANHSSGRTSLNSKCPKCGSLPRYRLLLEYLKSHPYFLSKQIRLLDIAPTKYFQNFCLAQKNIIYISIDIASTLSMARMDITSIAFKDNSFDVIICYHVLEHIEEDIMAMKELVRILKPDGFVIAQVPINLTLLNTVEYKKPNPKESRHVRMYGVDYKVRLETAGFKVRVENYFDKLSKDAINRFCLRKESIYFLTKC